MEKLANTHVRLLDLGLNNLGLGSADGTVSTLPTIQALAEGLPHTNIECLDLGFNHIGQDADGLNTGDEQIRVLMEGIAQSQLRILNTGNTHINTPQRAQMLGAAAQAARLEQLDLRLCGYNQPTLRALAGMPVDSLVNILVPTIQESDFLTRLREAYEDARDGHTPATFSLKYVNGEYLPGTILDLRDAAHKAYEREHTPGINVVGGFSTAQQKKKVN